MGYVGSYLGDYVGAYLGAVGEIPVTPPAPGPGTHQWVVAIEGYPYLLTDGDSAAALAAWTATDWVQCLRGLTVDLTSTQQLDPWNPFPSAGPARIAVLDVDGDIFGRDTHRSDAGAETYLDQDLVRDTTTVTVQNTTAFDAAPAELHIGTECIGYDDVPDGTTFDTLTRGKYAPFGHVAGSSRFAHHHRVGNVDYGVPLAPVVSQYPRVWRGRWVGIWLHEKSGGVLEDKADARLVWAGKITDVADDPNTGCTIVDMEHAMDVLAKTTLLRDQFAGQIRRGVWLAAGNQFTLHENIAGTLENDADPLEIVASGAAGTTQINEGYYTADEVCSALNAWLAAETGTNIDGAYSWAVRATDSGWRTKCNWRLDTTVSSVGVTWQIALPGRCAQILGLNGGHLGDGGLYYPPQAIGQRGKRYDDVSGPAYTGQGPPMDVQLSRSVIGSHGDTNVIVGIDQTKGEFAEQTARLPSAAVALTATYPDLDWGVFVIDGSHIVVAAYDGAGELSHVAALPQSPGGLVQHLGADTDSVVNIGREYGASSTPMEVRQIYLFDGMFRDLWKDITYSTGTADYNNADGHDVLGFGAGVGFPLEILGSDFDDSIDNLPGAGNQLVVLIDKATKFEDLFKSDLILRRTHMVFRTNPDGGGGGIRAVCWSSPSDDTAVYALTESNKFEPADSNNTHRTASVLSSEWARPIVKIEYNRSLQSGEYHDSFTIEDRTAIDDTGGEGEVVTIPARNTFGEFPQTGAGIASLAPGFISWHAFFSRSVRKVTRSIGLSHFFLLGPGDIVTVSDDFARDPRTGARGVSVRPGIITRMSYSVGGPAPGDPDSISPMVGEVVVALLELQGRVRTYSPCAEVDETANTGGFTAGYDNANKKLRCKKSEHGRGGAFNLFPDAQEFDSGDKVRIVQVNPDVPTTPLTWLRTVSVVGVNDITLTAALSSPAFDTTLRYRVIPDLYGDVQASQRSHAFQANDETGIVDSLGAPFAYGDQAPIGTPEDSETHDKEPERYSIYAYGDGAPRDTGYEQGLVRTSQHLIEHGTGIEGPTLSPTILTSPATGTNYAIMQCTPRFLQQSAYGASTTRKLWVSPFMRSNDGTATEIRVAICSKPPITIFGLVFLQGEFSVASFPTSSNFWSTATAQGLDLSIVPASAARAPCVYLVVLGKEHAQTRGLARCVMREHT